LQEQLLQEREANQERLGRVREELVKEVIALQHKSESAALAFQTLSNEVATTREELFARYAEVDPKPTEDAARADDGRVQVAEALQKVEATCIELTQDLHGRVLALQQQIAEGQEAYDALAN